MKSIIHRWQKSTKENTHFNNNNTCDALIYRPLGYQIVYLTLGEVADTSFYIQEGNICQTLKA